MDARRPSSWEGGIDRGEPRFMMRKSSGDFASLFTWLFEMSQERCFLRLSLQRIVEYNHGVVYKLTYSRGHTFDGS